MTFLAHKATLAALTAAVELKKDHYIQKVASDHMPEKYTMRYALIGATLLEDSRNWPMRATWTPFWIFRGQAFLKKSLRVPKESEHFYIAWFEIQYFSSLTIPRGKLASTNQKHYPGLASRWHQYWISALVSQTPFRMETSGGVAKMWAVSLSYRPETRNNCLIMLKIEHQRNRSN